MKKQRIGKVKSGILIPSKNHQRSKYPWGQMAINDSFEVFGDTPTTNMVAAAWSAGRKTGHRYICRKTPNGVRVWRVL